MGKLTAEISKDLKSCIVARPWGFINYLTSIMQTMLYSGTSGGVAVVHWLVMNCSNQGG